MNINQLFVIFILSFTFVNCVKDDDNLKENQYGKDFIYDEIHSCDDIQIDDKVYEGNVYFESQEEIVAFGEHNYNVVKGSIRIGQSIDKSITNLSPLSSLEKICGNLIIGVQKSDPDFAKVYITDIANLEGLSNLVFIQGNLMLLGNESLENIDSLKKLIYIGGNLLIQSNNELKNLNGLSNLQEIGGNIEIGAIRSIATGTNWRPLMYRTNRELLDFSGLGKIKKIGGYVEINGTEGTSNISFVNNGFNAFGNLQTLGSSSINISNVSQLGVAFKKLNNLKHLYVSQCTLMSLDNFDYTEEIETIDLTFNDNLQFDRVIGKTMKLIRIAGNPLIKEIAFPELQECETIIIDRSFLVNLNFSRLYNIGNTLIVLGNTYLKTIDLPELNSVRNLDSYSNEALITFSCPKLKNANSIRFHSNASILNIAFPELSTFIFGFSFYNNSFIKNISLPSLISTLENFRIWDNHLLRTVSCPNLLNVENLLLIENNDALESIDFEGLETVSEFEISKQNSLKEVNFKSLKSVDEMALIDLNHLPAFNTLKKISGSAKISQITQQSYSGFKNLFEVKQSLVLSNILIPNFDDSFGNLELIGHDLRLLGSNYIKFESLVEVSGLLSISGNYDIFDLTGLSNLETVGGGIYISNTNLETLELNKLDFVGVHHATATFNKEFSMRFYRNSKLKSYCSIKDTNFEETLFEVTENLFNPTIGQLRGGDCSQ